DAVAHGAGAEHTNNFYGFSRHRLLGRGTLNDFADDFFGAGLVLRENADLDLTDSVLGHFERARYANLPQARFQIFRDIDLALIGTGRSVLRIELTSKALGRSGRKIVS